MKDHPCIHSDVCKLHCERGNEDNCGYFIFNSRQHPYPPKMASSIREYLPRDLHFQPICIDKPCMGQIEICPCDDECDSVKQCAEHFHWLMENPDIAERNRKIADKIRDNDIAAYLARTQKDISAQQRIADAIKELETLKAKIYHEGIQDEMGRIIALLRENQL